MLDVTMDTVELESDFRAAKLEGGEKLTILAVGYEDGVPNPGQPNVRLEADYWQSGERGTIVARSHHGGEGLSGALVREKATNQTVGMVCGGNPLYGAGPKEGDRYTNFITIRPIGEAVEMISGRQGEAREGRSLTP